MDLKTTMIYVDASLEAGRKAVEKLDAKRHFSHEVVTKEKMADDELLQVVEKNGGWRGT